MSLGRSLAWTSVATILGAGCFFDPACLDADTIVFCDGREGEGYFRYTGSCGEAWACTGAPGSARCM